MDVETRMSIIAMVACLVAFLAFVALWLACQEWPYVSRHAGIGAADYRSGYVGRHDPLTPFVCEVFA